MSHNGRLLPSVVSSSTNHNRKAVQHTQADRLFQVLATNKSFSAVKRARGHLLVVESSRESTTRGVLVVDFLLPFDDQQLFFLVRSRLPVA